MRRRLVVSDAADDDVRRLRAFLGPANGPAWLSAAGAIADAIESLSEFPDRGRPMRKTGRRELLVPFGRAAYVIQYRVYDRVVLVARIFHSLEDRPLA